MLFTRKLREGIRQGKITCSVRIWVRPKVKLGGRYRMDAGYVEVQSIREISMEDITPELARRSGFLGVVDLMKVAKHGPGRNIYLVTFRYRDGGHGSALTRQIASRRPLRTKSKRGL